MPRFLMKVAPKEDLYMLWSTVVDSPVWAGTADEARASCKVNEFETAEERLALANRFGTSAVENPDSLSPIIWYDSGWQRGDFVVQDFWTDQCFRILPADKFGEFAKLYSSGQYESMMGLTVGYEVPR